MDPSHSTRKLAAIMFTDMVGYTTLTERGEARAIRARERQRTLLRPLIAQFEGKLVDITGDESLSSFPSALLAVDCALAIQAVLRDDPEIQLRIGVHLGDVLQQGDEIAGEGVNVASRIRPLAEPGGICVSESVYRLVRNRPNVSGRSLGAQRFKNVSEPMEVFALDTARAHPPRRSVGRRLALALGGLVATLALAYAVYIQNRAAILSWVALTLPRLVGSSLEQKLGFATTSDGVRIAYATSGAGPPLVFVLGWATHLERGIGSPLYDRDGWITALSAHHLLVRYDGRGFGLSDRNVDEFSLAARVRDLEAVVDALQLERFPIYTISAGGPTAIRYAASHPERVSALILAGTLAGPAPGATAGNLTDEQWNGMIALFRTGWDTPIVRSMMTKYLAPDMDEVDERVLSEFLRVSGDGPAVAGFFSELLRLDTRALARQLQVPALVIHGQLDAAIPLGYGRDLASLIPGAQFEILEGADHALGTIGSPEIPQLIEAFLARLPTERAPSAEFRHSP